MLTICHLKKELLFFEKWLLEYVELGKQLHYKNFFQLKKFILLWASSIVKIFDEACFIKQRLMTLNYHCVNV
jgi:hypothetical protein